MAVSDEQFQELDDLCKQMYHALCRVSSIPSRWGGAEVNAAIDAAESYIAKKNAAA